MKNFVVVPNPTSNTDDIIVEVENSEKWDATQKEYFYDESNMLYDSSAVTADGSITPKSVPLMRRWPSRFEIMSFVTPYGIGLDLGDEGKTWTFDVTDYAPILKGNKRMFLSRGGQNQEEMDIEFLFIKGTPSREVLDIDQIWPTQQYSANFTQIMANEVYFPPVEYATNSSAKAFKIRSAITGHGQEGEFIPRDHYIDANDTTYERTVWKSCGNNPVYPQGGTWIYDRAGWCPGMATDVAEYELKGVNGGDLVSLDYGVRDGSGDSRYIVNNQIVSYGEYNHKLDASIIDIIEPSTKVAYARDNPICFSPKMLVQNKGSDLITSISVDYWVNSKSNMRSFTWPCHLRSNEIEKVYFPIDKGVWSSAIQGSSTFHAEITQINNTTDEYAANNVYTSPFDFPEVYPSNVVLFYRTNNAAAETKIKIEDKWGNIVFERNDHTNSTLYRDTLNLGIGCFQLTIDDTDGDGMGFWANNDGSGFFRFWDIGGGILKTLNMDFGSQTKLSFTTAHLLDVPKRTLDLGYKLYPNPNRGKFTISGDDMRNAQLTVLNGLGQEIVVSSSHSISEVQLDLSDHPSGLYFVRVEQNGVNWVQKVIKE